MKHAYSVSCSCPRCIRERNRRERQMLNDGNKRFYRQPVRFAARPATRKPTPGSAEWAETRSDDLGESSDY